MAGKSVDFCEKLQSITDIADVLPLWLCPNAGLVPQILPQKFHQTSPGPVVPFSFNPQPTNPARQHQSTNMKLNLLALVLGAAFCAAPVAFAQTTNDMVRVEVRTDSKSDNKAIANSNASTKTQHTALQILLGGKPKSPETRVVKWYIFGKDEGSNNVKQLESGEDPLALNGSGEQELTTKTATNTYTPDHVVTDRNNNNNNNRNNNNNNNRPNSQKVKGSGTKYVGYVVFVKDGNTVLGKASSGQELEAEVK